MHLHLFRNSNHHEQQSISGFLFFPFLFFSSLLSSDKQRARQQMLHFLRAYFEKEEQGHLPHHSERIEMDLSMRIKLEHSFQRKIILPYYLSNV